MFCSPFHTEAQNSISKRIFILQAGLPDVLLQQVEGQLEWKETCQKAKLSPVSKVCNGEFVCFTHVIQLMVCLAAIQQVWTPQGCSRESWDRQGGQHTSQYHGRKQTVPGWETTSWIRQHKCSSLSVNSRKDNIQS